MSQTIDNTKFELFYKVIFIVGFIMYIISIILPISKQSLTVSTISYSLISSSIILFLGYVLYKYNTSTSTSGTPILNIFAFSTMVISYSILIGIFISIMNIQMHNTNIIAGKDSVTQSYSVNGEIVTNPSVLVIPSSTSTTISTTKIDNSPPGYRNLINAFSVMIFIIFWIYYNAHVYDSTNIGDNFYKVMCYLLSVIFIEIIIIGYIVVPMYFILTYYPTHG
jgi:hypothetical protein